jgi:hypothetical protein
MNNIPIFGEHPSQALKDAYRGYQGCPPEQAKIIFIGKDPNYSPEIEDSSIFPELIDYLEKGVQNYVMNPRYPLFRHHPFLNPEYSQGDGYCYHRNFRKVFGENQLGHFANRQDYVDYVNYAQAISFVEFIGIPTYGMIQGVKGEAKRQAEIEFNRLLRSDRNKAHLKLLRELVFESSGKTLYASTKVYALMQSVFPELKQAFPKDSYSIETLYQNQHGTCVKSVRHFSAAIKKEYFATLKKRISDSCNDD